MRLCKLVLTKHEKNKVRTSDRNSSGLKVKTNQARPEELCLIAEVPQEKDSWPSICLGIPTAPGVLWDSSLALRSHTTPSQGKAFHLLSLTRRCWSWQTAGLSYKCLSLPLASTVAVQYWRWNHHCFMNYSKVTAQQSVPIANERSLHVFLLYWDKFPMEECHLTGINRT